MDRMDFHSNSEGLRCWHAVYTLPRHEMSVVRQLDLRQVETFVPISESIHVWKNRQRVKVAAPAFPCYVFVHVNRVERSRVVQAPGVLWILGNSYGPIPLNEPEIEFLRSDFCRGRIEPHREPVIGQRVRICTGLMSGVSGTLVMKKSNLRFVLTIEMINQNASVEVNAGDVEPA